jgi:hypothetical protein
MCNCAHCGGEVADEHRFCPWCAAPQRLKIVDFFSPHAPIVADRGKMLRASRYLGQRPSERHIRFSVWNRDAVAEAAVSLGEEEANRLGRFILSPFGAPSRGGRFGAIVSQLRAEVSPRLKRRSDSPGRSRAGHR